MTETGAGEKSAPDDLKFGRSKRQRCAEYCIHGSSSTDMNTFSPANYEVFPLLKCLPSLSKSVSQSCCIRSESYGAFSLIQRTLLHLQSAPIQDRGEGMMSR